MNDKVAVLARLARALTRQDLQAPLAQRLGCAASVVVGADGAAVTLSYTRDERITLCATTDVAARIEDLQEVLGQGPGAHAYDSGEQVRATFAVADPDPSQDPPPPPHDPVDTASDLLRVHRSPTAERRPEWSELHHQVAHDFGPLTMLAVPIRPHRDVVGVLTFYAEPRGADRPVLGLTVDPEVAQFLADAVGVALLHDAQWHVNERVGAWANRSQVHQATGMVIAQLRVPSADALALLRAHAFAQGESLLEVCDAVLNRTIDLNTEPWSGGDGDATYGEARADGCAPADSNDSDGSTTA